jgi:hypothetical protein
VIILHPVQRPACGCGCRPLAIRFGGHRRSLAS